MRHRLFYACCVLALFASNALHAFDNWQEFPQPLTTANLWSVAYGERTLVAAGEQGTLLVYRYDDKVWLPAESRTGLWLVGVGYGAGRFVAVGDQGTILTSDDAGTTWLPRVSGTSLRLNAVAYGGGRWLAVGEQGTVVTSIDGTVWTPRPALTSGFLRALAYGRGQFLVGGARGALFASSDAETFTRVPIGTDADIEGAAIAPDRFFVVGSNGLRAAASNLEAWQFAPTPGSSVTYRGVSVRNEREAAAVGEFDAATFFITAQPAWGGVVGDFRLFGTAVTQGLNELVAVGFGGRVARSNLATAPPLLSSAGRNARYGREVRLGLRSSVAIESYQWTRDGVDIPGASGPELVFPQVSPADTGVYGVRFTTAFGSAVIRAGTPFRVVSEGRPELRDTAFRAGLPTSPTLVVPQPDGRLLVAGPFSVTTSGAATFGLARLTRSGALDPSFRAGAGIAPTASITGLALLPDGRIYVRGSFSSIADSPRPGLARLLPSGAIDPTFTPERDAGTVTQFSPAADGGLYVETTTSNGSAVITRLRADGTRDPSFPALADRLLIGVDTRGRILASREQPGAREFLRYLPDGNVDPTYTITRTGLERGVTYSRSVAAATLTERGLHLVEVFSGRVGRSYTLRRLKPDGGYDPTYHTQQISTPAELHLSLTHRPDGGVWVFRSDASGAFFADSYSPDGTPEPTRYATLPDLSPFTVRAIDADGAFIAVQAVGLEPEQLIRIRPLQGAPGRLVNLSVRSFVVSNAAPLIVGFVAQGIAPTRALFRAVGPALTRFGVNDAMPDPQLTLMLDRMPAGYSDSWSTALESRMNAVGAFPLPAGSTDAALEADVGAGDYTLLAAPAAGNAGGTILAEVYESAGWSDGTRRLVNLSARGVAASDRPHIVGFAIGGEIPLTIMLRAAGPALAAFGITTALTDPKITLYNAAGVAIWENDDWEQGYETGATVRGTGRVGAFDFAPGSKDAATWVTLAPGTYTAVVRGAADESGTTLLEVYAVE
jgi:uncharacterized delta-60 repeat protein